MSIDVDYPSTKNANAALMQAMLSGGRSSQIPPIPSMTTLIGSYLNQNAPKPAETDDDSDETDDEGGGQPANPTSDLTRAIGSYEWRGNNSAKTYGRVNSINAMGRYQVMPDTLRTYAPQILGRQVAPKEFLTNPDLQDQFAEGLVGKYYQKNLDKFGDPAQAAKWTAIDWYGHNGGRYDSPAMHNGKVVGESPNEYAQNVMGYMGNPPPVPDSPTNESQGDSGVSALQKLGIDTSDYVSVLRDAGISTTPAVPPIPLPAPQAKPQAQEATPAKQPQSPLSIFQQWQKDHAQPTEQGGPGTLVKTIADGGMNHEAIDIDQSKLPMAALPAEQEGGGIASPPKPVPTPAAMAVLRANREEQLAKQANDRAVIATMDAYNPALPPGLGAVEGILGNSEVGRVLVSSVQETANVGSILKAVMPKEFTEREEAFKPESAGGQLAASTIGGLGQFGLAMSGVGEAGEAVGVTLSTAVKMGTVSVLSQIAPVVAGQESLKEGIANAASGAIMAAMLGPVSRGMSTAASTALSEVENPGAVQKFVTNAVTQTIGLAGVGGTSSIAGDVVTGEAPNIPKAVSSGANLAMLGLAGGAHAEAPEESVPEVPLKEQIDNAAHEAATSPLNDKPEPTDLQKQTGNYAKGHVPLEGFDITIENPAGSVRTGTDANGEPWSTELKDHYGYIKGSSGADGDHLDAFIGPKPESGKVFVVDQNDADGNFDEHKVVFGATSEKNAETIYRRNYDDKGGTGDNDRVGAVTETTPQELKRFINTNGASKEPFADFEQKTEATADDGQGAARASEANTGSAERPVVAGESSGDKESGGAEAQTQVGDIVNVNDSEGNRISTEPRKVVAIHYDPKVSDERYIQVEGHDTPVPESWIEQTKSDATTRGESPNDNQAELQRANDRVGDNGNDRQDQTKGSGAREENLPGNSGSESGTQGAEQAGVKPEAAPFNPTPFVPPEHTTEAPKSGFDNAKFYEDSQAGTAPKFRDEEHPTETRAEFHERVQDQYTIKPEETQNATQQVGEQSVGGTEHQDGSSSRETTEASGSDRPVNTGQSEGTTEPIPEVRHPEEVSNGQKSVTGIANDLVDKEREERGQKPVMRELQREDPDVWDAAQKRIDDEPAVGSRLVKEFNEAKHPLASDEDYAILVRERAVRYNELDKAQKAVNDSGGNDPNATARLDAANEAADAVDRALRDTGTEGGRASRFRRVLVDTDDLSFAGILRRAQAENGGKSVSAERYAKLESMYDDLKAKRESETGIENEQITQHMRDAVSNIRESLANFDRDAKGKTVGERLKSAADRARERIANDKGVAYSSILPIDPKYVVHLGDYAIIAAEHIGNGIKAGVEFAKKMVDEFGENIRPHLNELYDLGSALHDKALGSDAIASEAKGDKGNGSIYFRAARAMVTENPGRYDANTPEGHANLMSDLYAKFSKVNPDLVREKMELDFNQYGKTREPNPNPVLRTLASIKRQGQLFYTLKDIYEGKNPKYSGLRPPEKNAIIKRLENEVRGALRQNATTARDPGKEMARRVDTLIKLTKNQEAKYQERIAKGDFSPLSDRTPIVETPELFNARANTQRAKNAFDVLREKDALAKRNATAKFWDGLNKYNRAAKISSPVILGKLAAAGATRLVSTPLEEVAGAGIGLGLSRLSAAAPREGGFSFKAEKAALNYRTFTDAMHASYENLHGRESNLDILYGGKNHLMPKSAIDYLGSLHAAVKELPKTSEFYRSLAKRTDWAQTHGQDTTSPMAMAKLANEAYVDAGRSILMQDNVVSRVFTQVTSSLEHSKVAPEFSHGLARAMHFVLPVVKIPTNIIGETVQMATGSVSGGVMAIRAYAKGIENIEPEQADLIMRHLKKGSIGLAVLTAGYLNPQHFGGYYQKGDKRDAADVKPDQMRFFGVDIPSVFGHTPVAMALQLGATIRRVQDTYIGGKPAGIGWGAWSGAMGLFEKSPYLDVATRAIEAKDQPNAMTTYAGEMAKGMLPNALSTLASSKLPIVGDTKKDVNGEQVKRKPETILQHIEMGIPGLRETVPAPPAKDRSEYEAPTQEEIDQKHFRQMGPSDMLQNYNPKEDDKHLHLMKSMASKVAKSGDDDLRNKFIAMTGTAPEDFSVKAYKHSHRR